MTIAAYQTLYESSVAFGMRKSLMSEQGKVDMEEQINQLEQEKQELEQQVGYNGSCKDMHLYVELLACWTGHGTKE